MFSFPNLEPVCCSMSNSNCCIQVSQEAGQVVCFSHPLKKFPQFVMTHRVKGFGIVNKEEVDIFLELSCSFNNRIGIGSLISGSSAFSKSSLNIWKFTIHYYWSLSWRILSITLIASETRAIVQYLSILWHCLSFGLEWKWTFSSPVATVEFSIFAAILNAALSQHHLLGFEIAQTGIPSPPLSLFIVMLPKAHLTSHSRMPGCWWVITPLCESLLYIVLLSILATSS